MKNNKIITCFLSFLLLFFCCFLTSGKERYDKVRIMTFNLGQFYNGVTRCPDEEIAGQRLAYQKLLETYSPDFIFTQENPEYMDINQTVLGDTVFAEEYKNKVGYTAYLGKRIISNYELFDYQPYSFSNERDYIKAYTQVFGYTIALYNVHLGLTEEIRRIQIAELLAEIQTEEFVVVAGDFNAETEELTLLKKAGYVFANNGKFPTYETTYIDNIILSPNIKILGVTVEKRLFEDKKDHRPLIATLGLKK